MVSNSEFFYTLFSKRFSEYYSENIDLILENIQDGISLIKWFYSRNHKLPCDLLYLAQQWLVPNSFSIENLDILTHGKYLENTPEDILNKIFILVSILLEDYKWTKRTDNEFIIRRDKQANQKGRTDIDVKYFSSYSTNHTYYGLFKVKDNGDLILNMKRNVFGNILKDDLNVLAKNINNAHINHSNLV